MVWVAVGVAAVGAVVTVADSMDASAAAKINTAGSKKVADLANRQTDQENLAAAAKGGLARWVQSLNNQKVLTAGGDALNVSNQNMVRVQDQRARMALGTSARRAEALGAAAASQGSSGVMGSVVDNVNAATRLRASIADQETRDMGDLTNNDQAKRQAAIYAQMVGGLDNSVILDTLDGRKKEGQTYSGPNVGLAALKGIVSVAGAYGANAGQGSPKADAAPTDMGGFVSPGAGAGVGKTAQETPTFRFNYATSGMPSGSVTDDLYAW